LISYYRLLAAPHFDSDLEWNCNTRRLIADLECLELGKWKPFVRFGTLQSHRKRRNEHDAKPFRHLLLASIVQEGRKITLVA
jgi:hypothetical protein